MDEKPQHRAVGKAQLPRGPVDVARHDARAFVGQPPILVADEPTGNLDPDTSVGIMQLLHRINRIGTTVVVATHDREMVDVMRKRVVALDAGRVVRDKARGVYADEV